MNREERRTGKQERRINHQAPRAAEAAGEDAELARFLVAGDLSIMFHDGKGRSLSVEEKVTILNALCASSSPAAEQVAAPSLSREEDYKALYFELLLSVAQKVPNETRHQTALRQLQWMNSPPTVAGTLR